MTTIDDRDKHWDKFPDEHRPETTIGDRDKHWRNVPDEYRPDILVYLGHVLYSYVDAGEEPPDYQETKEMLIQEGYKRELIDEQRGRITSMLWQTHKLFEKDWGQGTLKFPGMANRIYYGPNKRGQRPDILVYLGNVLDSYVDAGERPPDYQETKDMLVEQGYKRELIDKQKGKITSMLTEVHELYEKHWVQTHELYEEDGGQGMTKRASYGPNKQGPPKGGKRKRRRTKKGGNDDDAKKNKKE